MRWFSRRHRDSQTGDVTPNFEIHVVPPDGDPAEFERVVRHLVNRRRPEHRTARQVITAVLMRSPNLSEDPGHAEALVSAIMLGLVDHGLEIVQSGEVE